VAASRSLSCFLKTRELVIQVVAIVMEKFLKRKDVSFKIDPKQNLTQMKVLV